MKGFKDFLLRGNLVELAVAFIIGGAFAKVIESFTKIIIELLAKLGGSPNFDSWAPGGLTTIGPFITVLVSFVILAFVIYFALVKPYETIRARTAKTEGDKTTEELLLEIRDLLAKK